MQNNIPQNARPIITNDHNEDHVYVFEPQAVDAVNAALAINRPLLIRGEPGAGKSQLAKAAAMALDRTFIPFAVNTATEVKDLLWSFDAVARLADAQIEGALCTPAERCAARERLAVKNYIQPGPLWAALNWASAKTQYEQLSTCVQDACGVRENSLAHYLNADKALTNGVVLLIDEIDKADSSVPNGLLEVLGSNRFQPEGLSQQVKAVGFRPLIILTTNEERVLPDAFIRRCLSVMLGLPKNHQAQLDYLLAHSRPNFQELDSLLPSQEKAAKTILEAAAAMILKDREIAEKSSLHPLPGQAEYFDLLRGIKELMADKSPDELTALIESLARFTSKKHPDFPEDPDQRSS